MTGQGVALDVAMQDSVIPTLCSALNAYYLIGGNPQRTGNHHQAMAIAPYNIYPTRDGFVAIICMQDRHWKQLLVVMEREDLLSDSRFVDAENRSANMEETDTLVETWTSGLSTHEVFALCQKQDIVCVPVRSLSDVLNDPHLIERGALQKLQHPSLGDVMIPSTPLRFADVEPPKAQLPRKLGVDNQRVYGEFPALSPADVEHMESLAAI